MDQLPPIYFERLLESSLDIVVAVDREGQIIFYNDGAYKTLGYTSAEILGKHVATVYPSLDEARRVKAAMRSGEFGEKGKVKNFETVLVVKSREQIPVAISGSLIYDETGVEIGSIGFLRDLREIRRRNQLATLGELAKIREIISRIDEMAHGSRYDTTEYLHGSRMADLGREETPVQQRPEARPAARALAGLTILVVD